MSSIGTIVTIIIIVLWVVRGLASATGNKTPDQKKPRPPMEDWDVFEEEGFESDAGGNDRASDALAQMDSPMQQAGGMQIEPMDPSEMTMAQRIELARRRAREQAGGSTQQGDPAEALRRARQRAEQEARQRQESAQAQARAQREAADRARAEQQRQRKTLERRRAAEQQAQAEQRRRQKPRKQQRRQSSGSSQSITGETTRQSRLIAESSKRVHHLHSHGSEIVGGGDKRTSRAAITLGGLDRASLRKAFVLKEMLDKPIALRDPQDDLLS